MPQSGNRVSSSLGNSGLCWTVFAWNRDTVVPAEGNGDLQTLICVLVARPRRCLTLSNPVPWQNWMEAYPGYTLRMKMLFPGWPIMVHNTHMGRSPSFCTVCVFWFDYGIVVGCLSVCFWHLTHMQLDSTALHKTFTYLLYLLIYLHKCNVSKWVNISTYFFLFW